MTPEQTAMAITAGSGFIASALTEALNRATPQHKFSPRTLQALALTLAAAPVVGWAVHHGGLASVDWNTVVPMVVGAWAIALGVHDVASPRK